MQQITLQVRHVFREENRLEDIIANTIVYSEHIKFFHYFHQLPSLGTKLLSIDKYQVSSLRIRTKRIHIENNNHHF